MDNPPKTKSLRLGVLISGGGTTLRNLADEIAAGSLDATIACVISSSRNAFGLQRATNIGVPAKVRGDPKANAATIPAHFLIASS